MFKIKIETNKLEILKEAKHFSKNLTSILIKT